MRNIALVGLPGSGKSSVGRRLAEILGYPFFDTDELIETRYETSISDLFRTRGESWFRDVEASLVAQLTQKPRGVLATGGGVVVRDSNLVRLRQWGWVIALVAPPELLAQRLGPADHLPLVSRENPTASLARLWAERSPKYLSADLVVDVSTPEVDDIVRRILCFLAEREESAIPVKTPAASYDVYVGSGTLGLIGHHAAAAGLTGRVAVVTTPSLDRRHGDVLREALRAAGLQPATFLLPAGEAAKSWSTVGRLYGLLLQEGLDSGSALFALGGEELGDAAGFVAATYMRGIPLVHIPATLLAQLDSCVGGKVAINHPRAKNLIGAWHHPRLVLVDVSLAKEAGLRSLRAGLAEAVKYAIISDASLLAFLEERLEALLELDPHTLSDLVLRCLTLKARIVGQDEHEVGPRLLLNYGHIFAYALEAATGYRRFSHGEAVAIGMTLAARLGLRLGLTDRELLRRQTDLLHRVGLPTHFSGVAPARVLEALLRDKKRKGGRLRLVVPCAPGMGQVVEDVHVELVAEILGTAPPA
ncbi:MAG: 3-dehydroquinate synthase [Armatimonadota bacterium]|nr:3-dehydroquinate synthase [Armatimonadota bacterium]